MCTAVRQLGWICIVDVSPKRDSKCIDTKSESEGPRDG